MAQRTMIQLIDDIDGSEAVETITFALDGVSYEIDLNEENSEQLRADFASWVGAARRSGGRARRGTAPRAARTGRDLNAVREWARENGYEVSDRGRVAARVLEAYDAAH